MGAKLLLRILKGVGGSPPITEQVKELSAAFHLHFLGDTEQPLDQDMGTVRVCPESGTPGTVRNVPTELNKLSAMSHLQRPLLP